MGGRSRGFTIIELIVAISLVLLLMTITLPAVGWAREAVRQTGCNSNLMRVATATTLYGEMSRGYFPPLIFGKVPGHSGHIVILNRPPHAKAHGWDAYPPDALLCPSDEDPQRIDVAGAAGPLRMSLGYNVALILGHPQPRMQSLRQPAATALFYDGDLRKPAHGNGHGEGQGQGAFHGDAYDWASATAELRHYKTVNVLFADGHTATVPALLREMIYAPGLAEPPPFATRSSAGDE